MRTDKGRLQRIRPRCQIIHRPQHEALQRWNHPCVSCISRTEHEISKLGIGGSSPPEAAKFIETRFHRNLYSRCSTLVLSRPFDWNIGYLISKGETLASRRARDFNRVREADSADITISNMGRGRCTIRVGYAIITLDGIFVTQGCRGHMNAIPVRENINMKKYN